MKRLQPGVQQQQQPGVQQWQPEAQAETGNPLERTLPPRLPQARTAAQRRLLRVGPLAPQVEPVRAQGWVWALWRQRHQWSLRP